MNKPIKIVTDSTVDVPDQELRTLGIIVVPLTVTVDGVSYEDGVEITSREYVNLLEKAEQIPKSSQPPTGVFEQVYNELGKDGSEVLSIHMSSGMSGTYQSAVTAAGLSTSSVTVVDSQFISLALGFQVKTAAKMAGEGFSVEDITNRLNEVRKRTSLYIMVDTLEYLLKGGRIGRGRAMIGSLLKIKPIASLEDGVYTPVTKVRTHSQMIQTLTKKFAEETNGKRIMGAGIAQVKAEDLAGQLKEELSSLLDKEADFPIVDTTPIISTHTGPGALALMYYFDEE
ncbi:DegV family protein [Alkalicoccus saliphilus]|uniref:Fatty acid-binding protein DegV n=1 Tax=Alkalicoccus saliphilus TaxID=200989 RepID=A0A2T4UA69_9BACI|nr:DegV family protein [Alkalicoccus saliphilus]PTL40291.1 fatty acid-binding protein DegV [Alkalicoccus saliphilus]